MQLDSIKRRMYLGALAGGLSGLAGCPGTEGLTDQEGKTETNTPSGSEPLEEAKESVLAITDVSIEKSTVKTGRSVSVRARVENTGDTAQFFELRIESPESTDRMSYRISAGGEQVVEADPKFEEPGSYQIALNDSTIGSITVEQRLTYHVAVDGDDTNAGGKSDPLATIQEGINRAEPGQTVKVDSGDYQEGTDPDTLVRTVRDGEPDNPITITGPKDAVLRPSLLIRHSHVRLTGLTIEGLLDPKNPDDPDSYRDGAEPYPILISPLHDSDEYLQDIVCAPHGVGYSAKALINVFRTKALEIGPLEITGIAGASWILPDEPDKHGGEIIYLGSPPGIIHEEFYPWSGLDETSDVHIHHIDNSAGHPHSELVDAKLGTRDVLIEYCTDRGGSQNTESYSGAAIGLRSYDATVRWCEFRNGSGHGIKITDPEEWLRNEDNPAINPDESDPANSVYGNILKGFEDTAVDIHTALEKQGIICGNEFADPTAHHEQTPSIVSQECSDDVPEGKGIGHLGGESPWTDR